MDIFVIMRLLHSGKVKDVYEYDKHKLLFYFSDRISAFDVIFNQDIPRKGKVLCRFAKFWFDFLDTPHHMIKIIEQDKMLVEKLDMVPLEFVVRGFFYGSLIDRFQTESFSYDLPSNFIPTMAAKLPKPILDTTTKSDNHDFPISKKQIVSSNILSNEDYNNLKDRSIDIYNKMFNFLKTKGFILADIKFEYGINRNGEILLADSIGPDEYRLWKAEHYSPGKIQESFDKQILRDWLIEVGFKKTVDEFVLLNKKPTPPEIPKEIIKKLSERYILSFETITGEKF